MQVQTDNNNNETETMFISVSIGGFYQDGPLMHQARMVNVMQVGVWEMHEVIYVHDFRKWGNGVELRTKRPGPQALISEGLKCKLVEIYDRFVALGVTRAENIAC